MRKNEISLNMDNYREYLPISMVAFSVAESGAMGSPNEVIVVDKDNNRFSFYLNNMEVSAIDEIVPVLHQCLFVHSGEPLSAAPGWNSEDLGMGNHLFVADEIYPKFAKLRKPIGRNLGELYQRWIYIVAEILSNKQ